MENNIHIDESVYHEYVNWKLENKEFIDNLEKDANNVYYRFKHVVDVVEHLYNNVIIENPTEEEQFIFELGYYYISAQVDNIKMVLNDYYDENFTKLNDNATKINFLLNTYDYQTELYTYEEDPGDLFTRLFSFDKTIIEFIENDVEIPEDLFIELDIIMASIFEYLGAEDYSLNTVFLEIADELNIT